MTSSAAPQQRSRATRIVYRTLGFVFLGIAVAGIFLPLVPTTITTIVAGFFFSRSSERFDAWLVNHRTLGPIIRDHRAGLGFTRRAKTIGMTAMSVSIAVSTWLVVSRGAPTFVAGVMFAVWLYASWFILKQPTKATA
jgi:uncharacterized protein